MRAVWARSSLACCDATPPVVLHLLERLQPLSWHVDGYFSSVHLFEQLL